jgi:hypothetical protein
MAGNGRKIEPGLVVALAQGMTLAAASRRSGVSERSIRRRLGDPAFRQAVHEAQAALVQRAVSKLSGAATEAVVTIRRLLRSESESVRLASAKAILDQLGGKLSVAVEVEQRLIELERRADHKDGSHSNRWYSGTGRGA